MWLGSKQKLVYNDLNTWSELGQIISKAGIFMARIL